MTRRNPHSGVTVPEIVISVAILVGVFAIFATRSQDYMKKAKRSGASVQLNQFERGLKTYYTEMAELPVGQATWPDKPCCSYPTKRCPSFEAKPHDELWDRIRVPILDNKLQYSYRGTATEVTLTATGDPDCDGETQTYTLRGTVRQGNLSFTLTSPE